jgi:hypothetical protein
MLGTETSKRPSSFRFAQVSMMKENGISSKVLPMTKEMNENANKTKNEIEIKETFMLAG